MEEKNQKIQLKYLHQRKKKKMTKQKKIKIIKVIGMEIIDGGL